MAAPCSVCDPPYIAMPRESERITSNRTLWAMSTRRPLGERGEYFAARKQLGLHRFNPCIGRPIVAPRDQVLDIRLPALDDRFHMAVAAIADPATQIERTCHCLQRVAKANALNQPGDFEVNGDVRMVHPCGRLCFGRIYFTRRVLWVNKS